MGKKKQAEQARIRSFLFQEIQVESWMEFSQIARMLAARDAQWIFRGQGDSTWKLATTFERDAVAAKIGIEYWNDLEAQILHEFRRSAHQYSSYEPSNLNHLEWLAMIQHYGGPTRLLDFSKSPYIATFHALNGELGQRFSIWAINRKKVERIIRQIGFHFRWDLGDDDIPTEIASAMVSYLYDSTGAEVACNHYIQTHYFPELPLLFPVLPSRLNERIALQQGLFLMQSHVSPFENIFSDFLNLATKLECNGVAPAQMALKISCDRRRMSNQRAHARWTDGTVAQNIIVSDAIALHIQVPSELSSSFMEEIDHMNINMRSLFPGMDGYAKHMRRLLRTWQPMDSSKS